MIDVSDQLEIQRRGRGGLEVVRYDVSEGTRVVLASPGVGGVELIDAPADGRPGTAYRVDWGISDLLEYDAFLEDYVRYAVSEDACPMEGKMVGQVVDGTESSVLEGLIEMVEAG